MMQKRLLTMALAVLLCLSAFPLSALAAAPETVQASYDGTTQTVTYTDDETAYMPGAAYYIRLIDADGLVHRLTTTATAEGEIDATVKLTDLASQSYTVFVDDATGQTVAKGELLIVTMHTITFNANGGTGTMTPGTVADGTSYVIKDNTFTRSGHTFTGWNTSADGQGLPYAAGATIPSVTGNITLYTQWTPNTPATYTVSFNANGGSGSMTAVSGISGSYTLPSCTFTRTDYSFSGWKVDNIGSTLATGTSITVSANITLFAQWTANAGPGPGPGSGSGCGGGGSAASNITIKSMSNGKVTASPADPTKGDKVTLTVTPNAGYELDTLTVTDKSGKAVAITDNGDGTFSYIQPDGVVTVTATFKPKQDDTASPLWAAFTDISSHYAYDSICFVAERGLFNGVSETEFAPNTSMNRAMFATVLSRVDGVDISRYIGSGFSDVQAGQWYTGGIEWAAENGVVNGVGNNRFDPYANITREQMATMLYRYIQYKGLELPMVNPGNTFIDDSQISTWAAEAADYMQRAGIITGRPGNILDPQGIATRAEVAIVFARFIEAIEG